LGYEEPELIREGIRALDRSTGLSEPPPEALVLQWPIVSERSASWPNEDRDIPPKGAGHLIVMTIFQNLVAILIDGPLELKRIAAHTEIRRFS
jgi:hypothetical protein